MWLFFADHSLFKALKCLNIKRYTVGDLQWIRLFGVHAILSLVWKAADGRLRVLCQLHCIEGLPRRTDTFPLCFTFAMRS